MFETTEFGFTCELFTRMHEFRISYENFYMWISECEISVSLRKPLFRNFTFLPTIICTHYLIRFKHHLFDLTFMEKTSRWITNTQVKIKSEVSNFIFSYIPTVNTGGLHSFLLRYLGCQEQFSSEEFGYKPCQNWASHWCSDEPKLGQRGITTVLGPVVSKAFSLNGG